MTRGVDEYFEPHLAALIGWSDTHDGIFLEDIPSPDQAVVEVDTQNSLYEIAIIDANARSIAICGGKHLPEPQPCALQGSTWGGSCLKVGWIGIGMHLEVTHHVTRRLVTTRILGITITMDKGRADSLRAEATAAELQETLNVQ